MLTKLSLLHLSMPLNFKSIFKSMHVDLKHRINQQLYLWFPVGVEKS